MQARSGPSESEAMLGIVDDTEEKSQKDQVVTASKPSYTSLVLFSSILLRLIDFKEIKPNIQS